MQAWRGARRRAGQVGSRGNGAVLQGTTNAQVRRRAFFGALARAAWRLAVKDARLTGGAVGRSAGIRNSLTTADHHRCTGPAVQEMSRRSGKGGEGRRRKGGLTGNGIGNIDVGGSVDRGRGAVFVADGRGVDGRDWGQGPRFGRRHGPPSGRFPRPPAHAAGRRGNQGENRWSKGTSESCRGCGKDPVKRGPISTEGSSSGSHPWRPALARAGHAQGRRVGVQAVGRAGEPSGPGPCLRRPGKGVEGKASAGARRRRR